MRLASAARSMRALRVARQVHRRQQVVGRDRAARALHGGEEGRAGQRRIDGLEERRVEGRAGAAPRRLARRAHQRAAHAVHLVVQAPRRVGQRAGRARLDDVLREGAEQRRAAAAARRCQRRQRGQRARQRARHLGLAHRQRQQPDQRHDEEDEQEARQRGGQREPLPASPLTGCRAASGDRHFVPDHLVQRSASLSPLSIQNFGSSAKACLRMSGLVGSSAIRLLSISGAAAAAVTP